MKQTHTLGQDFLLGIRNNDYDGFTIVNSIGKQLFKLDLHVDPVIDNTIRGENSYSNVIRIPLNQNKFIVRFARKFYILNINGEIVRKLHPNTEWIYNWQTELPRVSLSSFPTEGNFKYIFIDNNGNQMFDNEIFDEADDFLGELAPVRRNGLKKWIIIDKYGKTKLEIQSMLEEDSEILFYVFHDIWSYRKKSTYEQRYITKSGFNSEKLSYTINNYHGIEIDERLLRSESLNISEFLMNSHEKYIFLNSRDKENKIIQAIYDKNLIKNEIAKPDKNGTYSYLKNSKNFIYGLFEYENKRRESIVISINKNEIIFRTKESVSAVIDGNVLCKSDSTYKLVDINNNVLFESYNENSLEVNSNYDSIIVSNSIEILEIVGLKGNEIPSRILDQITGIKTLVLNECRELTNIELSKENFPCLENLIIRSCNKLRDYNPWDKNLLTLKTYTKGFETEFKTGIELKCK